jgi:predicted AAA+ superfamily ATPase
MKLKPWYDVVKPREDLREGKSQDASESAVHVDRVRDGSARDDYAKPEQFFAKTFLATNLLDLAPKR